MTPCSNTVYNIVIVVTATPAVNTPPIPADVLIMICATLLACSMPRFIISVRELYDRDVRERWEAVDSGFGATSQAEKGNTSTIAFVGAGQEESRTLQGDIPLQMVGDGSRRV